MAFENANEFDEIVIAGVVGIRVVNGSLELKTLTKDETGSGYTITGDIEFPLHSFTQEFSDEFEN